MDGRFVNGIPSGAEYNVCLVWLSAVDIELVVNVFCVNDIRSWKETVFCLNIVA